MLRDSLSHEGQVCLHSKQGLQGGGAGLDTVAITGHANAVHTGMKRKPCIC